LFGAPKGRRSIKGFVLLVMGAVLIWQVAALVGRLAPLVREAALVRVNAVATQAANDAIAEEIRLNGEKFEDLVLLEKGYDGRVAALKTNVVKMNRLKADVTTLVLDGMAELDTEELSIPLGNLTGSDLFSGRGPLIPIKVVPMGAASARFLSVFESAGINQTKHQILLELTLDLSILLPGGTAYTQVGTQVAVSETVLVGEVPNSYTYIDDTESSLLGKINDYGEGDNGR